MGGELLMLAKMGGATRTSLQAWEFLLALAKLCDLVAQAANPMELNLSAVTFYNLNFFLKISVFLTGIKMFTKVNFSWIHNDDKNMHHT